MQNGSVGQELLCVLQTSFDALLLSPALYITVNSELSQLKRSRFIAAQHDFTKQQSKTNPYCRLHYFQVAMVT
eukprot:m.153273 g.153273  ORF g.153273 m.153273 type:complete len:73 (-) comp14285_c2_seq1:134-352(-)